MSMLVGISIDYQGKTFELEDDEITIGRSEDNQVTLNNSSVSGSHCTITREGLAYVLKDLGSTNGTRVNGQPIMETVLQDRDVIHFGSLEFLFAEQMPEDLNFDATQTTEIDSSEEPDQDSSAKPTTFSSVSPFGEPRKELRTRWAMLITIVGILALLSVGLLVYKLFFS